MDSEKSEVGSEKDSSSPKDDDPENKEEKKYPYPKSILFIVSTEFCERFSFYGMKSKFIRAKWGRLVF